MIEEKSEIDIVLLDSVVFYFQECRLHQNWYSNQESFALQQNSLGMTDEQKKLCWNVLLTSLD